MTDTPRQTGSAFDEYITIIDKADPYHGLREAAETIRDFDRHSNCSAVNAAADALEANAATILSLLAEIDRLKDDKCEANLRLLGAKVRAEKAEAALRKSEERAGAAERERDQWRADYQEATDRLSATLKGADDRTAAVAWADRANWGD